MTRIASLESVGPCLVCEGTGASHEGVRKKAATVCRVVLGKVCTTCGGSGLRPQKLVCPWCNGIGGYSVRFLSRPGVVTDPTKRTPPNGCILCLGNGFIRKPLVKGQEFDTQDILP